MTTMSAFTKSQPTERNLVISSRIEEISLVEDFIEELNQLYNFREDVYGNILITVTEAVNNAILHGNRNDSSKKIRITCSFLTEYMISFAVEDEGAGFDFKSIKDPTAPENLLDEHGRGVYVMQNLADEILYKGSGNIVELRFSI
ncbi:MAG: ATP-binding protein [Bacteroidetes bacterium]|nr:ATP-binding protein [Bacteroidota bacterium]